MVRTYYYDGLTDSKDDSIIYAKQRECFEALEEENQNFDINLGESVKTLNGSLRQKGVDSLLAIDALSMAYQDLYDSVLFLLGDRDFIPLIMTVKSACKKTFGYSFNKNVTQELKVTFDFRKPFNEESLKKWVKTK